MGLDGVTDPETGEVFNDSYMNMCIVKNRMGPEVEGVLLWDGEGGLVRDMTPSETDMYETFEKKKIKIADRYRYNNV